MTMEQKNIIVDNINNCLSIKDFHPFSLDCTRSYIRLSKS